MAFPAQVCCRAGKLFRRKVLAGRHLSRPISQLSCDAWQVNSALSAIIMYVYDKSHSDDLKLRNSHQLTCQFKRLLGSRCVIITADDPASSELARRMWFETQKVNDIAT
jgi:hypothetical protein